MLQPPCKIDMQTLAQFSRKLTARLSDTGHLLLLGCIVNTTKTYQGTLRPSLKMTKTTTTMSLPPPYMIWNTSYQLQLADKLWTFGLIPALLIYGFFLLISPGQNKRVTRSMIRLYPIPPRLWPARPGPLFMAMDLGVHLGMYAPTPWL